MRVLRGEREEKEGEGEHERGSEGLMTSLWGLKREASLCWEEGEGGRGLMMSFLGERREESCEGSRP